MGALNYVDKMKRALEYFSGSCAYCQICNTAVPTQHSITSCPLLAGGAIGQYISWRNALKYNEKYHGPICFRCHVPQCHDQLHRTFVRGSAQGCDYPDVIAPVAYAIYHLEYLRSAAQTHFTQKWPSLAEYTTWINSKPEPNEQSNLTALLLWYHNSYSTLGRHT